MLSTGKPFDPKRNIQALDNIPFCKMNSKSSVGNESACETSKLAEESILIFTINVLTATKRAVQQPLG
ncbi:hypothetical protein FACS1894121_0420 [Bacteroidia bacterium]|nr:hypothetical protein FACS1894121_0420 [Bacteroidia bacterium]